MCFSLEFVFFSWKYMVWVVKINCIWIENALGWLWIKVEARKILVWRRNVVTVSCSSMWCQCHSQIEGDLELNIVLKSFPTWQIAKNLHHRKFGPVYVALIWLNPSLSLIHKKFSWKVNDVKFEGLSKHGQALKAAPYDLCMMAWSPQ